MLSYPGEGVDSIWWSLTRIMFRLFNKAFFIFGHVELHPPPTINWTWAGWLTQYGNYPNFLKWPNNLSTFFFLNMAHNSVMLGMNCVLFRQQPSISSIQYHSYTLVIVFPWRVTPWVSDCWGVASLGPTQEARVWTYNLKDTWLSQGQGPNPIPKALVTGVAPVDPGPKVIFITKAQFW